MTIARQLGSLWAGSVSPAWIQAGVAALSVVLTTGLVYLYYEQRKLNALEYTAAVQAEGHRPSDDGRDLDVCLSNLGCGAATDLQLRLGISFPDGGECSGLEVEETPIKRLEQPNADDGRNEWARPKRNYVGPEQYFVRFWTPVPVRWETRGGDVDRTVLTELASELPNSLDSVRLTITLDYQDQLNDGESERIVDDVLPLEPGENLEYLFSCGMTHDEYERRNESDASAEPFDSLAVHRPHLTDRPLTGSRNRRENE